MTKKYNYEWKTAQEIIANRNTRLYFEGWGMATIEQIAGSADNKDFESAHKLWLKLKDVFNDEAKGYDPNNYDTSKLGSVGPVGRREILRHEWWDILDGNNYGDYYTITRIIEALHHGEKLETGIILFGS